MIKKLFVAVFLSAFSFLAVNAKVYTVESLPVTTSGVKKFVCNPDGLLSQQVVDDMCRMLQQLEDSTRVQVLVVAVDSISPQDDYRFAEDVGNHYGVGKKNINSGLVILLARSMGAVRFVTGEGLEGDMPDAICKRIIELNMIPYFKNRDWDGGMKAGVDTVYDRLMGINTFDGYEEEYEWDTTSTVILIILFGFPLLLFIYSIWREGRCPYCKKRMTKLGVDRYRSGYKETVVTHYLCKNCGRRLSRKSYIDHTPSRSSGGGGWSSGGGSFGGDAAGE